MEISDIVGGCLHNETSEPALLTAAPSTWNCQASGGTLTRTGSSLAGRELSTQWSQIHYEFAAVFITVAAVLLSTYYDFVLLPWPR